MRVLCIDDKNLPPGAEIESGQEYRVEKVEFDTFGTKAFLLKGIKNSGRTDKGLNWWGYAAHRFAVLSNESVSVVVEEAVPILN